MMDITKKHKIAIVHDDLLEYGGAEKMLSQIIRLLPHADIYTLMSVESVSRKVTKKKVQVSVLNNLPHFLRKHSLGQMLGPIIMRFFRLKDYDLVFISTSSGATCFVNTDGVIVSYIHAFPKNIFGLTNKWNTQIFVPYTETFKKIYISRIKSEYTVTNSFSTAAMLKKYCGVDATTIYPPIDTSTSKAQPKRENYFLTASRLGTEKNVELIVEACNKLKIYLKVAGTGKEEMHLREIAGPTVSILGFVDEKHLVDLYKNAKGFIFAAHAEDFGMAPAEALAHGCPVICYSKGGPSEFVRDGINGVFFKSISVNSIVSAMKRFETLRFSTKKIKDSVGHLSTKRFNKELLDHFRAVLRSNVSHSEDRE